MDNKDEHFNKLTFMFATLSIKLHFHKTDVECFFIYVDASKYVFEFTFNSKLGIYVLFNN